VATAGTQVDTGNNAWMLTSSASVGTQVDTGNNAWMLTSSASVLMMAAPGTGAVLQPAGGQEERAVGDIGRRQGLGSEPMAPYNLLAPVLVFPSGDLLVQTGETLRSSA